MKRFFAGDGGATKFKVPSLKTDTGGLVKSVSPGRILHVTGKVHKQNVGPETKNRSHVWFR